MVTFAEGLGKKSSNWPFGGSFKNRPTLAEGITKKCSNWPFGDFL